MSKEKKNKLVPKLRFSEFRLDHEWIEDSVENVCETFSGGTPSTTEREFYGGTIPFIRSAEIDRDTTELCITESGLKNSSAKLVKKGDVLFALYGANSGEVALSRQNGAINQAVLCLRSAHSNVFIYHFLSHRKAWIVDKYIQGGQGNLSGEIVKSIKIPFPSLKEQKKIADCLSSLDDLIFEQSQKLEALNEHKKGLMQQLFPTEGETIPKLRLKEFKGAWKEKALEEIGQFKNGINFSPDQKGDGILTVDVLNMFGLGVEMKLDSLYRVDIEPNDYLLKTGDILFVRSSLKRDGVGWATLFKGYNEPVIFCGFLIRLRIDFSLSVDPTFLLYYLRSSAGRENIISLSGTAAITNISQESLKKIKVPLPSVLEQKKIASCLSSLDDVIIAQSQRVDMLIQHKKGLMQSLFPNADEL